MKKGILIIAAIAALMAGCKPKVYTGPLDSPIGNWKSSESHYFFAGEEVYQDDKNYYSAISFYKDSLCCIEGVKGAFKWRQAGDSLVVDSMVWKVITLTGERMELNYLGIIEKQTSDTPAKTIPVKTEGNTSDGGEGNTSDGGEGNTSDGGEGNSSPETPLIEYKGKAIESDGHKCWYIDNEGKKVNCWKKVIIKEDGSEDTACWWDFRTDYYIPF